MSQLRFTGTKRKHNEWTETQKAKKVSKKNLFIKDGWKTHGPDPYVTLFGDRRSHLRD